MSSDRFLQLVTKRLAGSILPAENDELNELLKLEPLRERCLLLEKFWQQKKPETQGIYTAFDKVSAQIQAETVETGNFRFTLGTKYIAPVFGALALLITLFMFYDKASIVAPNSNGRNNEIVATILEKQNLKGTRSLITLADGTKVWLNADSKLQYPVAFTGATREVELSGEAFFEVTKNSQKPFIIHLSSGTVRVLGTSFNIKAYPGERVIETSVATGRVAFVPAIHGKTKINDTTFLTKDFKAIYTPETGAVQTVATQSLEDKAWTEGKLIFHAAGMNEIATALERYFGKQVIINDEEIRNYRLTGSFENDTVEEILYYLSKTKPFTYKITETQILISLVR